jgi:uncharacterized cupin superfamily protein
VSEPLEHRIVSLNDVGALGMEPWPIPRGEWGPKIHGDPEYGGKWLYISPDRQFGVAIEYCGPCEVTGAHGGEVCYYLEGYTEANPPGGKPYVIRPGDLCYFPKGMQEHWQIKERHVKVLVVTSHGDGQPLPVPGS